MISLFYQLISCFALIDLCSGYKVRDYVKKPTADERDPELSVANSGAVPEGITRLWAIKLNNLDKLSTGEVKKIAEQIARELQLENLGQIGQLSGVYTFAAPNYTYAEIERTLRNHGDVAQFERHNLVEIKTYKSALPDHRQYANQWHIFNQSASVKCNVTSVWRYDIQGQGVVVAIVDEGVDWRHKDLTDNYFPDGSYDFINDDNDPTPSYWDHHGTKCAGVIAGSAENSLCGVGVAYRSKFSAIDILSEGTTYAKIAEALDYQLDANHIYSNSWGPSNDGKTAEKLNWIIGETFYHGAKTGRDSYGSIFVFAAGNGGDKFDNCNFNQYTSSIFVIPITSVTEYGVTPTYAERCNSVMASTVSGENLYTKPGQSARSITTTDTLNRCSSEFSGTSASASLASGIIALMLQVRPCLYWRDVHHIIAMTSSHATLSGEIDLYHKNQNTTTRSVFDTNKAGYTYNDRHGFGFLDAWRVVNAARVWKPVPGILYFHPKCYKVLPKGTTIMLDEPLELSCQADKSNSNGLVTIENVIVKLSIKHEYRGMLEYLIICPSGTESVVATRPLDTSQEILADVKFRTVKCWGESPLGEFKLRIRDIRNVWHTRRIPGKLLALEMTVFGSAMSARDLRDRWNAVERSYSDGGDQLREKFISSPYNCPLSLDPLIVVIIILLVVLAVAVVFWMVWFCVRHTKKKTQIKPEIKPEFSDLELDAD